MAKALARLMMGPKEFYNLVNKQKRFYVAPADIASGFRTLTNYDVTVASPAFQIIIRFVLRSSLRTLVRCMRT